LSENKSGLPLWQGRSSGRVHDITLEMGESISLDIELYEEDIRGSSAHAAMLHRSGILTAEELSSIQNALGGIKKEIENGEMELRIDLEDIHTHIENRLTELIGEAGKKLHTARSRNDQVAVDTHLFVKKSSLKMMESILALCETLLKRASENIDVILPGYTHMQVAQPVRLSHHLLSHYWSFLRDFDRFANAHASADRMPLGSGAMAGVNYATDREFLRKELDFASIYPNSMDAVSTRDHILDFLYSASMFMLHISRISEEIIIWNSIEFSFITLPDSLTTGSSIMPQKKNPDLAELSRGKTGRVYGHLLSLLTNLKGLPLTYNRDLQEDRLPLLDTFKQAGMASEAMRQMIESAAFNGDKMQLSLEKGFATATDLADALVSEKKVPFREAHHITGALVGECVKGGYTLQTIPKESRKKISPLLEDDQFFAEAVDLKKSADKKISAGGTARNRQLEQISLAEENIKERKETLTANARSSR